MYPYIGPHVVPAKLNPRNLQLEPLRARRVVVVHFAFMLLTQHIWQAALVGLKRPLTAPPGLRAVGRYVIDPQLLKRPSHLRQVHFVHLAARLCIERMGSLNWPRYCGHGEHRRLPEESVCGSGRRGHNGLGGQRPPCQGGAGSQDRFGRCAVAGLAGLGRSFARLIHCQGGPAQPAPHCKAPPKGWRHAGQREEPAAQTAHRCVHPFGSRDV